MVLLSADHLIITDIWLLLSLLNPMEIEMVYSVI